MYFLSVVRIYLSFVTTFANTFQNSTTCVITVMMMMVIWSLHFSSLVFSLCPWAKFYPLDVHVLTPFDSLKVLCNEEQILVLFSCNALNHSVKHSKMIFSLSLWIFLIFSLLRWKNISQQEAVLFFKKSQIFSSLHTNQLKNGSYSFHNVVCIKNPLITDYNWIFSSPHRHSILIFPN